MALLLRKQ